MSGQEQQGQGGNAGTDLAWMIAGAFAGILAIWFSFKEEILHALLVYKFYQLEVIFFFSPEKLHPALDWLVQYKDKPVDIDNDVLMAVLNQIGAYYRYPVGVLCVIGGAVLLKFSPSNHFKSTFNMTSLRQQEVKIWPQITPIAALNLAKTSIDEGPWSSALSPMEFCIQNGILIPPVRDPRKPNEEQVATINEEKARLAFKKQMGPRLLDPDALPIHVKALIGIFAARAMEERVLPAKLNTQMASTSADVKAIDFTGAQELFDKYKNEKLIQKIFSNHAYVYTMMATMLEVGRSDGVLATSDFLWLKAYDRPLWYVLNNVGRQTAFAECAGPFSHWRAEKSLGRRLNTPMVEECVKGFKGSIENIVYTGDKEKWELQL